MRTMVDSATRRTSGRMWQAAQPQVRGSATSLLNLASESPQQAEEGTRPNWPRKERNQCNHLGSDPQASTTDAPSGASGSALSGALWTELESRENQLENRLLRLGLGESVFLWRWPLCWSWLQGSPTAPAELDKIGPRCRPTHASARDTDSRYRASSALFGPDARMTSSPRVPHR